MSATHEPILFEESLGSPAKVHVKNLNHITEVLSMQTPGPGSRTRRFSRFAMLKLAFTALHAEMEGLLWAAACMRERRITSVRFETDCSDLVDMTTNPMDWPAFATEIEEFQWLQDDFEDVRLSHIPRCRNGRADALAKDARTRDYIFSHIDQTRTDGNALRRIGSFVLHLI